MKKILTFLLTALLAFSVGWADEVSVTFSDLYSTNTVLTDVTIPLGNGVTITFAKPGGTAPQYYTNGTAVRWYARNTMTVASTQTITQIVLTFGSSDGSNTITTDVGSYNNGTWTGSASSVLFTVGGTSGNRRLSSVTVTYSGGGTTVAPPTISPAGGDFVTSQQVTLSHADGGTIYYTLDGTDPTTASTEYTAPFTLTSTTTVKAIAVKNGESSTVASATFTKTGVANIAEALAVTQGSTFTFTGNAVVTYQNGRYVWIRDNSGSGLIFRKSGETSTLNNGAILDANWTATNTTYNSIPEFTNPTGVTSSNNGGTVAPFDMTLTGITTADVNKYVSFSNVTTSWDNNMGYVYVTINNNKVYFRNDFIGYNSTGLSATSGGTYNIEGIAYMQNGNAFVYMTKVTAVSPILTATPDPLTFNDSGIGNTFTVEGSNLGTDNVGLTQSGTNFTPTLTATTGGTYYGEDNGTTYWGFSPANGSVVGEVAMSYTGRELSASETVTLANNLASTTVTVNYRADVYILGNYGSGWDYSNGTLMTYDATNSTYTAAVTVGAGNLIVFARKLGENNPWGTRYLFGPDSDGDCWVSGNFSGTIDLNDDDPIYFVNAGTYIIEINATTGALKITKDVVNAGDFELVTNVNNLVAGNEIIFVSSGSAGSAEAMSTTQRDNNRGVTDVTISSTLKVTATNATQIFTLEGSSSGWYFKTVNGDNQGYIYAASNSSNHLKTEATADDNAKATISLASDGAATIVFQGSNSRNNLRYNSSNNPHIYSCYASNTTQAKPYIYQRAASSIPAPEITPAGGTENKRYDDFNVTITADGYTIYYTTDGTDPTTASTAYTGPFNLPYNATGPTTVKAIAVDGDGNTSSVTTVVYYWGKATVTITPASQSVGGNVDVTIAATPAEATVVYTVNGGAQQPYNGQFQVTVDEENPEVTVIAYATMGQSEATDTATYAFRDLGVNSIAEFLALEEGDSAYFKNPVVVLFDYSQNSSNGQEYIWVKDRTGYTQFFIAPQFDAASVEDPQYEGTYGEFVPKYENGDVIPAGFKVKKAHYATGDYYQGQCYETHGTFQIATEKALADPEQVTLTELLNSIPASTDETSVYNNRYLYINKLKLSNISGLNFRIAADEDGNGTAEIEGGTDIVGYNKYNSPAWKNKQGQTVGVELPTDGAFYNVKFIFQKWSSGYEIMPIEFTKWEETSLRLEDLVEVGVENNQYTISNQLIAAAVTWDADQEMFAIFAKDDEMYASKSVPADGMKNYLISYKNQDGSFVSTVEQKDYDQSNWIEILIPTEISSKMTDPNAYQAKLDELKEDYENKFLKAGTVKGTYVDTLNPTIRTTSNNLPVAESEYEYAPNIFCTANFLMENLDSDGATSYRDDEFGGQYFMMDGKPQEFCKVVWAFFEHTDNYFVAPAQEADTINGHNFHGSFLADMSLCEDSWVIEDSPLNYFTASKATTPEKLFGFRAIVRKNPNSTVWSNSLNGGAHRITASESPKESVPAYIVYPLNSETSSNDAVTAVKDVMAVKEVVSVSYYNLIGQASEAPFEGINIVVTRYSDGSMTSRKVLR